MGRKNKSYSKDLHQQAYEKLTGMQHFGESKKAAVEDGTEKDKIFSYNTYSTYWKHAKYFVKWIQTEHPECTTLKSAKKFVNEWLQSRVDQVDGKGQHLSAWTIQTEAAALNKLYQIDKADPNRFQPPKRNRSEIKRSRVSAERDKPPVLLRRQRLHDKPRDRQEIRDGSGGHNDRGAARGVSRRQRIHIRKRKVIRRHESEIQNGRNPSLAVNLPYHGHSRASVGWFSWKAEAEKTAPRELKNYQGD